VVSSGAPSERLTDWSRDLPTPLYTFHTPAQLCAATLHLLVDRDNRLMRHTAARRDGLAEGKHVALKNRWDEDRLTPGRILATHTQAQVRHTAPTHTPLHSSASRA